MEKEKQKSVIKKYIFIFFLVIAIAIAIILMIVYNEKGEINMPYKLEKIIVQSSIDTQNNESENLWDLNISQNNDIYIYINKNTKNNTETNIKNVKVDNIKTTNKIGKTVALLPTNTNIKTNYINSVEDFLPTGFEYKGATADNMQLREIGQNGGLVAFRLKNQDLGKYISNEGEEIKYNNELLKKSGIDEKDIIFDLSFDLSIETTNDEKYKGTITITLPVGNFEEKGSVDKEITDFSKVVFKRSE